MAPSVATPTGVLSENDEEIHFSEVPREVTEPEKRKPKLVYKNIVLYTIIHGIALYGLYVSFTRAKVLTTIYAITLYQAGMFGITAGAHRLWSHRSYKANLPLRLILVCLNTLAFQNSVIEWSRDHRVHHKFTETDADPHNAKRGFFFSHVGWLLCKKHPEVIAKGKGIDLSDLYEDPILAFQHKHYYKIMPIVCFVLPVIPPIIFWGETFGNSFFINILRFIVCLHATWLVNSAAHLYGQKPYDKHINPSENLAVSIFATGEGWHNYHHTFPWDYKTAELGKYSVNFAAAFIDFFSKIGWAYELKSVSVDMVKKRVERTGDGTHEIWGWGDKDQPEEDYKDATITYRKNN